MDAKAKPPEHTALGIDPMEIVRFIYQAAGRNVLTCILVGVLTLGLGLAAISAIPRKYESTAKVYVTSTGAITSQLTSGRRSAGDEAALKDIREWVFNHENLAALARSAKLVENWPKTRNWFQKLIDRARMALRGPISRTDQEEILVAMLEPMIEVKSEDTSSIRFRAAWRDPWSAQKLTESLQSNYIAAKEVEELSAITRATTVLEDELRRADAAFEPAVTELKNQIAKARERAKNRLTGNAAPRPATPQSATEIVISRPAAPPLELTAKLNELRSEERAVLEPWQRRTAELRFQLADLRAVYGPAHPTVVQLETKLRAASAEPVELLDIRQRETELKANIASWAVATPGTRSLFGSSSRGTAAADSDPLRDLMINVADDPDLAPARLQLENVLRKTTEMSTRLDAARMELAIAQVSFKYRYRQVEPARFWSKPVKPKVPALIVAAIAAALVIGFLAGAGRELLNGKIMETWQVRQMGLEVIASVDVRSWQLPPSTQRRSLPPPRRPT